MKFYITLLIIILNVSISKAQETNFNSLWGEVESLEKKGLPKSALQKMVLIKNLAEEENNTAQQIKALIYQSKFAMVLEEDAQLKIINDFKAKIESSDAPAKNVLQNYLANLYWQYFQQHRYQFYDRTRTDTKVDEKDIRTWDLETLFAEIDSHFEASLDSSEILKKTDISKFNALIDKQKSSKKFRPTLYDLLAHNALDFYKTKETAITQPANEFIISDIKYMAPLDEYTTIELRAKDSTSLQLKALKIYQDLIEFHSQHENLSALVDVDIERLRFVNENATYNNKAGILLKTLKDSKDRTGINSDSALYDLEIATLFSELGMTYSHTDNSEHQWKLTEAVAICDKIISEFPESEASQQCDLLKQRIIRPSLSMTTQKMLPVDRVAKILIRYKNLNTLSYKIHRVSTDQIRLFNTLYREDEQLNFIENLGVSHEFTSTLKNELDYQYHTIEDRLPPLENGHYIILAESENEEVKATTTLQATDFALVEKENSLNYIFQLIHRTNGSPIKGAAISFSYRTNNSNEFVNREYTTDKIGQFKIEKSGTVFRDIKILAEKDGQTSYFENYYVPRKYDSRNEDENLRYNGFIFTDRSIYRPGQTVYFKAIAIKTKDKRSLVLADRELTAELIDVNYQSVKSLHLKTNEFGSVSGEFILPSSGLNGQFHIKLNGTNVALNAQQFFSVEEYKRPRFKTKFNPISTTYKVDDTITVDGQAMAYAGSSITNAKVVYRVYRKVQLPRWYYWSRPWTKSEAQEIISGETRTDDSGNFIINFRAIPDLSIDKENLPIFNYEVIAEVTDINGETREALTTVRVGYQDLTASIEIPEIIDKEDNSSIDKNTDAWPGITIETKNLNGESVSATGTFKIYKLRAPEAVLRNRPWAAPDYKSLNREEFKRLFPFESFDGEENPKNWELGEQVFSSKVNTEKTTTITLEGISKYNSGMYKAVLEIDKNEDALVNGEVDTPAYVGVKDEKIFKIVGQNDKRVADNQLFEISLNKEEYRINDKVELTVGSASKDLVVTVDIEKDHKIIKTYIIELNDEKETISIPVDKNDLGGFAVLYSYAFKNTYKSGAINVSVPYPKSDLSIETATFRDKLKPGQEETWEFMIKGPKGDEVSAELLASMYDLSLDQFKPHDWIFNPLQDISYYTRYLRRAYQSFNTVNFRVFQNNRKSFNYKKRLYDQFEWFGLTFGNNYRIRGMASMRKQSLEVVEESEMDSSTLNPVSNVGVADANRDLDQIVVTGLEKNKDNAEGTEVGNFESIQIRKNLQETAFFFPQLKTDIDGNIRFGFTTPEALTTWKLQLLAHNKDLESSVKSLETITQKELMVIPNAPRFLRQGDKIVFSLKISNLTENDLLGTANIILTDALTGQHIEYILRDDQKKSFSEGKKPLIEKSFEIDANGDAQVSWLLDIPDHLNAIQYKVVAKAGNFSDGEQNTLAVLTNRKLITETLPIWVKSNETKTFTLDKLKSTSSTTLKNHKLTLEVTSNPAWYAVQSLPYLMEYPYDCNEQIFSRVYANSLASYIANSNPRIKEVFDQWASSDELVSNLESNDELKSILIAETPWLRAAQSETEQKKRIGMLFDINKMSDELQSAKRKLEANQMQNGSWPWFKGGLPNRFITQHIITGFGHLDKLNVNQMPSYSLGTGSVSSQQNEMVIKALNYLDSEFIKEYNDLKKYNKNVDLKEDHLSYTQLHYLYMRSFYQDVPRSTELERIIDYYQGQIKRYWLTKNLYSKGMMALICHRYKDSATTEAILNSLKETSITSNELGMYWKENTSSWHWYAAPIETQALLIEAFSEVEGDNDIIDNLKIWLLKNKQTNSWGTTKATTDAAYALLLQGGDWLSVAESVELSLGTIKIDPHQFEDTRIEAGTGYFKTSWNGNEVEPQMAEVTIQKKTEGIAWGALYWQYFEDLDKITSAETPLKLKKKLFKRTLSDTGEVLNEILESTVLEVGDLVRVRIELHVDRAMEFIHMKDMRASGLEPLNVISTYKWQDGLGYYESTKDASTNFFFDYLPKGSYVFEYDLRINNAGNMGNGITTIQSMYAPEFSSNSEGVRIEVAE